MKKLLKRFMAGSLAMLLLPVNGFAAPGITQVAEDQLFPEEELGQPYPMVPEDLESLPMLLDEGDGFYADQIEKRLALQEFDEELQALLDSLNEEEEPVELQEEMEPPVEEAPADEKTEPPVEEAPADEKTEPPVEEAPADEKTEPPVEEAPAKEEAEPPVEEAPADEKAEPPVEEAPAEPVEEAPAEENAENEVLSTAYFRAGEAATPAYDSSSKTLYANGVPITIDSSNIVKWTGGQLDAAIANDAIVFGGSASTDVANTSVTLDGGTVKTIIGGGLTGNVTGDTEVTLNSGTVNFVIGGCAQGNVDGKANITVGSNAKVVNTVFGGSSADGTVSSTSVIINGGNGPSPDGSHSFDVFAAGEGSSSGGTNTGNTYLEVNSGNLGVVCGGGFYGQVTGSTNVQFKGGNASALYGGGYYGNAAVLGKSSATVTGGSIGASNVGGAFGGGCDANSAEAELIIRSGETTAIPYAAGGSHFGAASKAVLKVERGSVTTAVGGNASAGKIANSISVTVSGKTLGQIGSVDQLILGEGVSSSTSSAAVTFKMEGGFVKDLYAGQHGTLDSTVDGGNIMANHISAAPFKNSGGKALSQVKLMTKDGSNNLIYALGGASVDAGVTIGIGGTPWYTKLGGNGELYLLLPAGNVAANAINVMVSGVATYYNEKGATVGDTDGFSIELAKNTQFKVTFGVKDAGTGSVSVSGTNVNSGDKVEMDASANAITFTATPASGYHFVGWILNGNAADNLANPASMAITQDIDMVAEFIKANTVAFGGDPLDSCTVTAKGTGITTTTSANNAQGQLTNVPQGTVIKFSKSAVAEGYEFISWKRNGVRVSTADTYTITVGETGVASETIVAECVTRTKLNKLLAKAEVMHESRNAENYQTGESSFTEFNTAYDNAKNLAADASQVQINAAADALAEKMTNVNCKIIVETAEGGTITPDKAYRNSAQDVELTVTTKPGYTFNKLVYSYNVQNVDGTSTLKQVTLYDKNDDNTTRQDSYTIAASVIVNGSDTDVPIELGAVITVTPTFEANGYEVAFDIVDSAKDTDDTDGDITTKGSIKAVSKTSANGTETDLSTTNSPISSVNVTDTITFKATAGFEDNPRIFDVGTWYITDGTDAATPVYNGTPVAAADATSCTATVSDDGTELTLTGVKKNVKVTVDFNQHKKEITTEPVTTPEGDTQGTMEIKNENIDKLSGGTIMGHVGSTITVTAKAPSSGYEPTLNLIKKVDGRDQTTKVGVGDSPFGKKELTDSTNNIYTFTFPMPDQVITLETVYTAIGYMVTCTTPATGTGTLSVQKTDGTALPGNKAAYNETVHIKLKPAKGYKIKANNPTVKYGATGSETSVPVTKVEEKADTDGEKYYIYSFTMPAADVTVAVEYEAEAYAIDTATKISASDGTVGGTVEITGVTKGTDADAINLVPTQEGGKYVNAYYKNTVSFTVTPTAVAAGDDSRLADYVIKSVQYAPTSDLTKLTNATEVDVGNGQYSFAMPNYPVTIVVKFDRMYTITDITPVEGNEKTVKVKVIDTNAEATSTNEKKVDDSDTTNIITKVKAGSTLVFSGTQTGAKVSRVTLYNANNPSDYMVLTPKDATAENLEFEYHVPSAESGGTTLASFAMNMKVKVEFAPDEFKLTAVNTVTSGGNTIENPDGSISVDPKQVPYLAEKEITVVALPATGKVLDKITLSYAATPDDYTQDVVIGATADTDTSKLTNGVLSPKMDENGVHEIENTYTFTIRSMVDKEVKVTPTFKAKEYAVTTSVPTAGDGTLKVTAVNASTAGSAPTLADPAKAYYNNLVTVTVTGASGKMLSSLKIKKGDAEAIEYYTDAAKDAEKKGTNDGTKKDQWYDESKFVSSTWTNIHTYTFQMPAEPVTVTATFEAMTYTASIKSNDKANLQVVATKSPANSADEVTRVQTTAEVDTVTLRGIKQGDTVIITKDPNSTKDVDINDVKLSTPQSSGTDNETPLTASSNSYSFVMPAVNVSVTVGSEAFPAFPGGYNPPSRPSTTSSGSGTPSSPTLAGEGTVAGTPVAVTPSTTTANSVTASVSQTVVANAISSIGSSADKGNLVLSANVSEGKENVKAATYTLDKATVNRISDATDNATNKVTALTLETPAGAAIMLDPEAIKTVAEAVGTGNAADSVKISVRPAEDADFNEEQKATYTEPGMVVYSFKVNVGDDNANPFSGTSAEGRKGKLTLQIPYTLPEGVSKENVKAFYLDAAGNINEIANSTYTTVNGQGMVIFETTHLSLYGVRVVETTFADVKGHWAKDAIIAMERKGIVNGVSNTEFQPDTTLKRCMLVTMLGRMADVDDKAVTETGFDDVSRDAYYAPFMAWAKENGLAQGTGNGKFAPDNNITREQLAVLVYRYANLGDGKLEKAENPESFSDDGVISDWAKEAVYALKEAGILDGMGDNEFVPKGSATRAQVCVVLKRLLDKTETVA